MLPYVKELEGACRVRVITHGIGVLTAGSNN
jgi:hypothetical protein